MSTGQTTGQKAPSSRDTPFWVTRTGARFALVALHGLAAISIIVELAVPIVIDEQHPSDRLPVLEFSGSYALYGFTACVLLVLLGIGLRRLVMRGEDYYGSEG